KVIAGPERKSRRLAEEEKRRVAFHEGGHALVAAHTRYGEKVHKISIVPRGRAALGYTMHLPADDQYLMSRAELVDRITSLLGGARPAYASHPRADDPYLMSRADVVDRITSLLGRRAAEQVVFEEVPTGAENDLERATALAQQMICMYGMGHAIGLVHCAKR